MKLWRVIQWGNVNGGPNEADTNIIISAPSMKKAISLAEQVFEDNNRLHRLCIYGPSYNNKKYRLLSKKQYPWLRKEPDCIVLFGKDDRSNKLEPLIVIRLWIDNAIGSQGKSWHYHNGKWVKTEKLFKVN